MDSVDTPTAPELDARRADALRELTRRRGTLTLGELADAAGRVKAARTADELEEVLRAAACLSPLFARVPEGYRNALELTDLGELTQDEAAARLGLITSGMKSRVQRGRRMLRAEVARCCRIELDARGALADANIRDDDGAC